MLLRISNLSTDHHTVKAGIQAILSIKNPMLAHKKKTPFQAERGLEKKAFKA